MKLTARDKRLRARYGITEQQYAQLAVQGNLCCWICGRAPKPGKSLHVDHNHGTGEIRGLLCFLCNKRLIGRHTDPDLFATAAAYLREGTGLFVPKRPRRRPRRKARKARRQGRKGA